MAYLSKDTVINALRILSNASPKTLNNYSAIQYFVAVDRFSKLFNRDCDSSNKSDKESICNFVSSVVSLDDGNYLSTFKKVYIGKKKVSATVSSNFFSGSSVDQSKKAANIPYNYPMGEEGLLIAENGLIKRDITLYDNINYYLSSKDEKLSLALWLIRKEDLDSTNIIGVRKTLLRTYSEEFTNLLISAIDPSEHLSFKTIDSQITFSDIESNVTVDDIASFIDIPAEKKEEKLYLEIPVMEYITHCDNDSISETELSSLLDREIKNATKDNITLAVHNFAIRYAPHIDNCRKLAMDTQGNDSISSTLSDGKKIGLYLRDRINGNLCLQGKIIKPFEYEDEEQYNTFLTALRTKPFLLLAGISGTGKSQKVQELAFMTCPKNDETHNLRDPKSTTPGNYQLVEVKPNWHDSTELLGYYSALSGKYELTDFIRFTYKALQNTDVPFFLCLDEMNLAPVEQYFAEFLSVLETRKKTDEGIKTQPLLTKDKFSNCELMKKVLVKEDGDILEDGKQYKMEFLYSEQDSEIIEYLKENGLHLPDNLFVIGTVNMDDTTHQFSRKVIDRAFTIEMNGGKMGEMFTAASKTLLEYREEPLPLTAFQSRFVRAYEVLDDAQFSKYAEKISKEIPALLGDSDGTAAEDSINGILNNTPFRVSYRVQNELVLYLSVLIENADFPDEIDELIGEATLAILLEKVLPRVQGEQKQLETKGGRSNILKDMTEFVKRFAPKADENGDIKENPLYTKVVKKLEEMDGKLTGYYTNFF